MGCGASQSAPTEPFKPTARATGEAFEFTAEDPSDTLFRGIKQIRSEDQSSLPRPLPPESPSSELAHSASARAFRNSDRSPVYMRASTRADAIINGRPAVQQPRRARVTGSSYHHMSDVPKHLFVEKGEATTLFLQKAVRSHQNSALFGDLTQGAPSALPATAAAVRLFSRPSPSLLFRGDSRAARTAAIFQPSNHPSRHARPPRVRHMPHLEHHVHTISRATPNTGHLDQLVRAMKRIELNPFDMVIRQGDADADCCYICGEGCAFDVLFDSARPAARGHLALTPFSALRPPPSSHDTRGGIVRRRAPPPSRHLRCLVTPQAHRARRSTA